jgi:hypothetical protein
MSVAMASLRRVARKCPVLRECQQCIRDSVEFPASSSSTVTSQHNRVAAPCAHFVPRNFHRAVMSPPCSCQRRIARRIEDSGKQPIVPSVDFCAQLVPNNAKRPPGGGGRSRVVRGSCPSWARTRTLLIQSQACCQLHQGAGRDRESYWVTPDDGRVRPRLAAVKAIRSAVFAIRLSVGR